MCFYNTACCHWALESVQAFLILGEVCVADSRGRRASHWMAEGPVQLCGYIIEALYLTVAWAARIPQVTSAAMTSRAHCP